MHARSRRWARAMFVAYLATTFALTSAMSTSGLTPATPPPCLDQSADNNQVTRAHPVVLVHGWDGHPMTETRAALADKLPKGGWQFLLFDYSAAASHWASRDEVAGCLAKFIQKVSTENVRAKGDGKVFVVAHSMGGLATSYAVNPNYGQTDGLSARVGGLVTIDTPWTGSPWGRTGYAFLFQTLARGLPTPTSDAWLCLRSFGPQGSGGCSTPAYLPKSIPVAQIAGDITVQRSYFGLHAYDIPLASDTLVPTTSQHGYVGSAPGSVVGIHTQLATVKCKPTLNSIVAAAGAARGARGGPVGAIIGGLLAAERQLLSDGKAMDAAASDQASAAFAEFAAVAYKYVPCSHTNMPKNPDTISAVAAALRGQAAASADGNPSAIGVLAGTWTGPVPQPNSRPYTAIVRLRENSGTLSASVSYPELRCSGNWRQISRSASVVSLHEHITSNVEGGCVEDVGISLTLDRDDRLVVTYLDPFEFTATLTRD
jgi:pimeloyl-ACP methyl ester carboxylesterase